MEIIMMLLPFVSIPAILFVLYIILKNIYTVVEPNKAHIVVFMGRGRKVYTPHIEDNGDTHPTAYLYIPLLMKRIILPLSNVKMEIPSFELRDEKVAPFKCQVTCWFRIKKPDLAVEKLDIGFDDGDEESPFEQAVRETLEEQVSGIARAAAMKQEILDIMRERKVFGDNVENEVNGALKEWGLELVKLEIVDFTDKEGSTVIKDYEAIREADIKAKSRIEIATRDKEASVEEAKNKEEAGIAQAQSAQEVLKANVEKDKQVDIATQEAAAQVQEQKNVANEKAVEAQHTLEVGQAEVKKEATIKEAEGEAEAARMEGKAVADVKYADGEADAKVIKDKGAAEATVIKGKGLAKAEAINKEAEALKKYNDAGITIETIRATVEVEKAKYEHIGNALSQADINIVQGGDSEIPFIGKVGPEQGSAFAQALKAFENVSGVSTKEVVNKTAKAITQGKSEPKKK